MLGLNERVSNQMNSALKKIFVVLQAYFSMRLTESFIKSPQILHFFQHLFLICLKVVTILCLLRRRYFDYAGQLRSKEL